MPLAQQQVHTAMGQDTLLHGGTLFVIPTTDSNHITLPLFTQSVCSNFWGHMLLIKSTKFVFITHFNEFLTASGWERDVQLHLEAADHLRGTAEKRLFEGFHMLTSSVCVTSFFQ